MLYCSDENWIKLVVEGKKGGGSQVVMARRRPGHHAEVIDKRVRKVSLSFIDVSVIHSMSDLFCLCELTPDSK